MEWRDGGEAKRGSGGNVVSHETLENNLQASPDASSTAIVRANNMNRKSGSVDGPGPAVIGDAPLQEEGKEQVFLEAFDDWGANDTLPYSVRSAFQLKFMVLLQLQLLATLGIASGLTYMDPLQYGCWQDEVKNPHGTVLQGARSCREPNDTCSCIWNQLWFVWFFLAVGSWTYLMKVADQYPRNYLMVVVFTCCLGFFFGACWDLFYSRGHIQMLVYTNCAYMVTLILSNVSISFERKLMSVSGAAFTSYFLTLVGLLCVQGTNQYSKWGDIVKAIFMFSLFFLACGWESCKMLSGMNPDKYMLAVIYVYSDLWMVIVMGCVCVVCGWFLSQ